MQVGDLVKRSYNQWSNNARIGLVISQLPKDFTYGRQTGDFFVVQWSDGIRDTIRSQFLEVVNTSR